MLSIYVFKISSLPSPEVKIVLSVACSLISILPFFLPEQTSFSFNLSHYEPPRVTKTCSNTFGTSTPKSNQFILNISEMKPNDIILEQGNNYLSYDESLAYEDFDLEESIFVKDLIEKINLENASKSGKLNPLYEEDFLFIKNRSTERINDLDRNQTSFKDLNDQFVQKIYLMKQGSTKF